MVITHKKPPDLELGQHVMVQNQWSPGNLAKKWDRASVVVKYLGYNKYTIRMDDSFHTRPQH